MSISRLFCFYRAGRVSALSLDAPDSPTCGHRIKLSVGESNRQCVIVPPGVVHAYRNVGTTPGWVFNAPNRLYAGPGKGGPVDEVRHEDKADSPYRLD